MFNYYTAQMHEKKKERSNRTLHLRHLYLYKLQKTRPQLIASRNQRLSAFIQQSHQKPFDILVQHKGQWQHLEQYRNIHQKDKFIGGGTFVFRNEKDWKSNKPASQRSALQITGELDKKFIETTQLDKSMIRRSLISQTRFADWRPPTFRDRNKSQQLNKGMTYRKIIQGTHQTLSQTQERYLNQLQHQQMTKSFINSHRRTDPLLSNISDQYPVSTEKRYLKSINEIAAGQQTFSLREGPQLQAKKLLNKCMKDQFK